MIMILFKDRIIKQVYRNFLLCLIILLINVRYLSASTHTQDSINKIINNLKSQATQYDKNNDVYNAIYYYSCYLKYKNKDIKSSYRLASLYYKTRDYSNAFRFYDSVLNLNSKKFPLAWYYKGSVCMNLEKYDDAIDNFAKFRKVYKKYRDKNNYRKLAGIYIESAEWAKSHKDVSNEITISHLGNSINQNTIEFSPFPVNDNMILYGALYSDTSKHIMPIRQIFKAVKLNGQWQSKGLLGGAVNNFQNNTGNAVLSEDGDRMYFTRSRMNWQNKEICELYVSYLESDTWKEPQKLPYPINDENYTSTQPAIGKNLRNGNDVIYFVSNRSGGKGGLDIWYTELDHKTGLYKDPHDLDKGVNTIGDECTPFYDLSTRTLYFSSNGRNGLGGFDIYKSLGSTKNWTDAQPLEKPLNSQYDDYYFSILSNNKEGFFTSNRQGAYTLNNGSCCDDIFYYKINTCAKIYSWGTVRNSVNYDFYNHLNEKYHLRLAYPENNIILPDVPVELYIEGNKENDEIMISKTTTDLLGKYHFELERNKHYKVLVKNYGYFEKKVGVNTVDADCADTINIGNTLISYLPKVNVRVNIYYEHDKSKLSEIAKDTIDTYLIPLFDLFPNAIVEIGSHTDSTGTDGYNMKLSQKRSESVVNYLISKGISSERLVAKGYGMRFPIAPNTNSDGTDNPDGRQLNRRTEIKIVGEINTFNIDE